MIDYPVKLLAVSYGVAALIGLATWAVGWPLWLALLLAWFGGAFVVLAMASSLTTARPFQRDESEEARNLVSEEEYRLWDDDLQMDQVDLPLRRSSRG